VQLSVKQTEELDIGLI